MVSHYFKEHPQTRPLAEVMHDILSLKAEAYFVVSFSVEGEPIVEESSFGVSRAKIVEDLADGQFDHNIRDRKTGASLRMETPYAVYRLLPREQRFEIVTQDVARDVAKYIVDKDYFPNEWRSCPFLDAVWPNWRNEQGIVAA
ncbi:MAG: hypothetical protein AAGF48_13050 [Pseudomonadota bacterium]